MLFFLRNRVLSSLSFLTSSYSEGFISTSRPVVANYIMSGVEKQGGMLCELFSLWRTCAPLIEVVLQLNISEHFQFSVS